MKKIILTVCLVLLLTTVLVGCGNRIEERSERIKIGMTYADAVDILGKEGVDTGSDKAVYSWDCGEGKNLVIWLEMPYDDHDHSDPYHTHNYDYPDDFVITKFEIVETPVSE